jgi:hypothetical protein
LLFLFLELTRSVGWRKAAVDPMDKVGGTEGFASGPKSRSEGVAREGAGESSGEERGGGGGELTGEGGRDGSGEERGERENSPE